MSDDVPNDDGGSAGGGDDDRPPWTPPELRVMLERLDGRMDTTEARFETTKSDVGHTIERLGTRLTVVIMGVGGLILGGFGVTIALLSFLLTRSS